MRVVMSGASGLIGNALRPALGAHGHESVPLVRRPPRPGEIQWNPNDRLDPRKLEGFDAVIHLSGKNIAGRWTENFKREVFESRVPSTRTLATAAADSFRTTGTPRVLLSASAVGYYADRGDEVLIESSPRGAGFVAELTETWEQATGPAAEAGLRVANLRIGVVLTNKGGALQLMLPAFRMGLGGRLGDGRQYMSWISLDDVVGAFVFTLETDNLRGPVNAVGPGPVRNAEFVHALGEQVHRPTMFPVPASVVRLIFGQMGEELLLASARAIPEKLNAAGYRFHHPDLGQALQAAIS
jgi:hypothetical protein